ncbi:hypothetical protein BJX99DRAFT_259688 [Aspergillus californicus]
MCDECRVAYSKADTDNIESDYLTLQDGMHPIVLCFDFEGTKEGIQQAFHAAEGVLFSVWGFGLKVHAVRRRYDVPEAEIGPYARRPPPIGYHAVTDPCPSKGFLSGSKPKKPIANAPPKVPNLLGMTSKAVKQAAMYKYMKNNTVMRHLYILADCPRPPTRHDIEGIKSVFKNDEQEKHQLTYADYSLPTPDNHASLFRLAWWAVAYPKKNPSGEKFNGPELLTRFDGPSRLNGELVMMRRRN